MDKRQQQILAYAFGVSFLVVMLAIAIFIPKPTPSQFVTFRVVLSLAAAGVAAMIPGFLHVQVSTFVRASGALAVFAIVYFYNPPQLVATPTEPFKTEFKFKNAHFVSNVESSPLTWNYGFSSVERDSKIIGRNAIVKKVKVTLDVVCKSAGINMDVWAFFGPNDFGLPAGQVSHGGSPLFALNNSNGEGYPTPPTQLKVGIGGDHCPKEIWASYDFDTGTRAGSPHFASLKESFNPPMKLSDGLFAQLMIWTGSPDCDLEILGAVVEVEGELIPS